MFTTIITDCYGENERGRQIARFNSLGLGPTDLIGIGSDFSDDATIEGGADLVDIIDATEGKEGVVVLNVAPRGDKNEGTNGNSFCYFYYKKTLIISTVKGHCLSFVKKNNVVRSVNLMELSRVLDFAADKGLVDGGLRDYIVKTQFRSFDFVPRLARWLIDGVKIPSSVSSLANCGQPPFCVWHVDAFGNAKLTLTPKDLSWKDIPTRVSTNLGVFPFYKRLKDVPKGETAIYIGSSGIGENRFLELATQGIPGSAAKKLGLKTGDEIAII